MKSRSCWASSATNTRLQNHFWGSCVRTLFAQVSQARGFQHVQSMVRLFSSNMHHSRPTSLPYNVYTIIKFTVSAVRSRSSKLIQSRLVYDNSAQPSNVTRPAFHVNLFRRVLWLILCNNHGDFDPQTLVFSETNLDPSSAITGGTSKYPRSSYQSVPTSSGLVVSYLVRGDVCLGSYQLRGWPTHLPVWAFVVALLISLPMSYLAG
ncbi:hypothetical protein BKA82DRAFT_889740 [Pisolithus tinctorius]|uniref:Uncharacterized protein n=1 Tax=Pisolithus tinctorius Marx 270 TaxID=870435 RepID=A0A0C3IKX0_PISTI|nr:hypothetical protein BKA82DRAFT_889740 [Pisolithus tinctorius]KIN97622.1 hypothetical protein M404DRAFT_889740 [Pisolithus tinctorius Marx 270]